MQPRAALHTTRNLEMALVDSLLSAIVRADGDALVMHVGERPYVVVGTLTINISTHGLNLEAMTGMLAQLLPADAQTQLEEFGAVEYRIPQPGDDRFSVVAARGGDDIWIEIRRRRPAAAAQPKPESAPEPPAPSAVAEVAPPTETPVETPPAAGSSRSSSRLRNRSQKLHLRRFPTCRRTSRQKPLRRLRKRYRPRPSRRPNLLWSHTRTSKRRRTLTTIG